jgi:uncharacterized membrane protein
MKYFSYLAGIALFLNACANQDRQESSHTEQADSITWNAEQISSYVGEIDEQLVEHYKSLVMSNYQQGKYPAGIEAHYTNSDKPVRIYIYPREATLQGAHRETWIYLDTVQNKPLMIREMLQNKGGVLENTFFYANNQLIQSETRKARDINELNQATFEKYTPPNDSFGMRVQPDAAATWTASLIDSVWKIRPELSETANMVRRMGASYWASGNEPGWTVTVIPQQRIELVMNYGSDTLHFPYVAPVIGTQQDVTFQTKAKGKELHIKFIPQACTDSGDQVSPWTVSVRYEEKNYLGCGHSFTRN